MGFVVFLYHRVHPQFGIAPVIFRKQMDFLKRHFNLITLNELKNRKKFPSAMVTFDDGFSDFLFYAFPILKELSIPSIIFVSTERVLDTENIRTSNHYSNVPTHEAFKKSFLEKDNFPFLSWGELRYLDSTGLVSVESHALTHRAALGNGKPYKRGKDWRIFSLPEKERGKVREGIGLTSILVSNYKEAEKELKLSKEILENKLEKRVRALAWPWGIYDEKTVDIAKDLGYEYCFTTERGFNRKNFFRIKRLAVSERKNMFWFKTRGLAYSL